MNRMILDPRTDCSDEADTLRKEVLDMLSLLKLCMSEDSTESLSACFELATRLEANKECFDLFCMQFPYQRFIEHVLEYDSDAAFMCLEYCMTSEHVSGIETDTLEDLMHYCLDKLSSENDDVIERSLSCLANICLSHAEAISYLLSNGILDHLETVNNTRCVVSVIASFCSTIHDDLLPCVSFLENFIDHANPGIVEPVLRTLSSVCDLDPIFIPVVFSLVMKHATELFENDDISVTKRFFEILLVVDDLPSELFGCICEKITDMQVDSIISLGCKIIYRNSCIWNKEENNSFISELCTFLLSICENVRYDALIGIIKVFSVYYTPSNVREAEEAAPIFIEHLSNNDTAEFCVRVLLEIAHAVASVSDISFMAPAVEPLSELLDNEDIDEDTYNMVNDLLVCLGN